MHENSFSAEVFHFKWPQESCGLSLSDAIFNSTDLDASAHLTMDIDWESTTATKGGQLVDGYDFTETLVMVVNSTANTQEITGQLKVASDKFIDKEQVDELQLKIFARDENGKTEQRRESM